MFRNKAAVDRHVLNQFKKVTDEKERNLRCYNVAKLYYSVQDYESARRYVSSYLEVKADSAPGHKLHGEILEALGQKEKALIQYKQSLELESRQDDLVLKVCDLLTDPEISIDANSIKYWTERANERFKDHPIIFQLKERMLINDKTDINGDDLEALIISELSSRPSDIQLRVKLIKYYVSKNRYDDAYKHATTVESTFSHRDSLLWYETLCTFLTKFKEIKQQQKSSFWILYLSSLERYTALSIKEQGIQIPKTIQEAIQILSTFDQALTESKTQNIGNNQTFIEQMYCHMFAQLNYHLACLIIRRTKREQGNWTETGRLCAPLLLSAMHCSPIDASVYGLKDPSNKAQVCVWRREAAYRCSQASHILQDYINGDIKRLIDTIDKFCIGSWRERLYQRVFTTKQYINLMQKSYFANNKSKTPPIRLLSHTEISELDEISEQVYPASLHHHVWLGIVNKTRQTINHDLHYKSTMSPLKNQYCHVFPGLQLSAYNLNQASPDSLSQLDIDAFLNSAILCSYFVVEEKKKNSFLNPDRFPTLPADLTNDLCTSVQEKWWLSAYKIYRNQDGIINDIGEIRQDLQMGLEVVRCIGNHGLHPFIIVQLAKIFQYRAKLLKEKDASNSDLHHLESRYELYWSTAIPLLERLINNQTIRFINTKVFDYQGADMNNLDLSNALEEARLTLAEKLMKEKKYEEAIESLQSLKCPEASCLQGEIYKKLADELIDSWPRESLLSEMRSQYAIMLTKSRNCYYLTLDRLRSPGIDPNHPLNSELATKITAVENDLKKVDPDFHKNNINRNDCDGLSDESYSSAHSEENHYPTNSFKNITSSRMLNVSRIPKQASTPRPSQDSFLNDMSRSKIQFEARPSPERLDAQLRQLIYSKDTMISTVMEQYKSLVEANKTLVESNKTMKDMLHELRREFNEFRKDSTQKREKRFTNLSQNVNDDNGSYVIEDDLYEALDYTAPVRSAMSHARQQRHSQVPVHTPPTGYPPMFGQPGHLPYGTGYSQMNYPPAAVPGVRPNYPLYPHQQIPGTNEVQSPHMAPLYSPSVYQMPYMYPGGRPIDQAALAAGMQQRQNIFAGGMINPLTEMISPQLPPQIPSVDLSRPSINDSMNGPVLQMPPMNLMQQYPETPQTSQIGQLLTKKDAPVNKAPPVNVVITTSDTLPTTAPPVQPTLSVTIPPQHINSGINSSAAAAAANNIPHTYQISMPSHATIPTTVILPPLSATITNTIAAGAAERSRQNVSLLSTGSHNSSAELGDVEHDPIPDFKPIIPLPDKIKVTTGEENEEELYCARAKLFRHVDKEWKDRGIGNVKLLKSAEGKVRFLMRRDQVLKICANHYLTEDMELRPMVNSDKAWMWIANDFADQEVKLETLCIRFKTTEEAQTFKEKFDKAKSSLPPPSPVKPVDKVAQTTTVTSVQSSAPITTSHVVGGFSFNQTPVITQKTLVNAEVMKKTEEAPKPSPFVGFSFTKSADSSSTTPSTGSSGFSFGKTTASSELKSSFAEKPTPTTVDNSKPSLAEMFKPPPGSWECTSCYTRNNASAVECLACESPSPNAPAVLPAADKTLAEMFKPPPGSWECSACYTRNNASAFKCLACEEPSPNAPPSSATDKTSKLNLLSSTGSTLTFKFGIDPSTTNSSSTAKPNFSNLFAAKSDTSNFTFGVPSSNKDTKETTLGFNFKPSTTIDNDKKTTCSGLQTKPPLSSDFTFGNVQDSNKNNSTTKSSFSFSTSSKPFEFQLSSKSTGKSTSGVGNDGDASEDEVVESEDIYFAPIIPLPDKIDIKTGEEDEHVLYTHRAKLFRYDSNSKEWKERGLGDVKLLKHKESNKLRLVMRRERTLKLCLNQNVPQDIDISPKDDKTWMWNATDFSEGEIEHVSLACRFKTSDMADDFKKALDDAIAAIDNNETSLSKPVITTQHDIQVLYELSVTEEEKNAAIKLKLPENFYSYKRKDDCRGCRGCQEPDVPLFDEEKNKNKVITSKTPTQVIKLDPPKLTPPTKSQVPASSSSSSALPVTTSTTTVAAAGFGTGSIQKPFSLDTSKPLFGAPPTLITNQTQEQKPTFSFATKNNTDNVVRNLFGGNLNVCSPTTPTESQNQPETPLNFSKINFADAPSSGFGKPSIFGSSIGTQNMFGGSTIKTDTPPATSSTALSFGSAPTFSSTFSVSSSKAPTENIFGSISKDSPTTFTNIKPTANIFGGNNLTTNTEKTSDSSTVFGDKPSPFSATFTFANFPTPTASTTTTTATATTGPFSGGGNMFGEKQQTNADSKETVPSFLETTDNAVSFETLAAQSEKPAGFTTDPNFSFAGAGQSVFGSKTINNSQNSSKKTPQKPEDDGDGEEENYNDEQEHDPHFEPIIPLPDAIEVKTGEEDEEIKFSERAKLYRYESETKEWKERGVGEMKLLHHIEQERYRLLLRREQVYKVVCNMALTADFDLQTMSTSDRAWVWAGRNYAEDTPTDEKLAVRFKNPDLAQKFKKAVDTAKEDLRIIRESNTSNNYENHDNDPLNNEDGGNDDDEVDDVEDGEETDECEDGEEITFSFFKPGTLMLYDIDQDDWTTVGTGIVKMMYDSDHFATRIDFEDDNGQIQSSTVIMSELEADFIGTTDCTWTAFDEIFDPPAKRTLRIQFEEEDYASEFYNNFLDGVDEAKQSRASEEIYYDIN